MKYQEKLPSRPHQIEAENKMEGKEVFALLMAMRTGKTKTAIDDYGKMELAGAVKDVLVFAPNSVYRTWLDEFTKHASDDLRERILIHVWETGGGKGHSNDLKDFLAAKGDPRRPRLLLANIEAASGVDRFRDMSVEFVGQRRAEIIIDESTTIKNHGAKRTKFLIRKLKPLSSYRRILTGLPTPRDPLDLFGQFTFLDEQILRSYNYFEFRARYAVLKKISLFNNRLVDIVVGFKNLEHLKRLIEPYSFRIRLEDIVDIPVTYTSRRVEMTDEQKRMYKTLKEEAIAEIEEGGFVSAPLVVVRMLRLHQMLCGHVRDTEGVIREVPENRTKVLMELLEEFDGKAIIWCSYDFSVRRVRDAISEKYGDQSVCCFWGGNVSEREDEDKRFRTDPKCRFMIATPDSGGRGRKWDVADTVIYYSSRDNLEHRDQSEERAKDMTKTSATLYVDLMTEGTVDELIIKALRNKIDLASTITGENFRQWLI